MLQILGRRTSGNVMLPLWVADEIGLPYEHTEIGGQFGGNDLPEYLAKNPNGLVPTIIDDGFVLWESNAITRYLCAKHSMGNLCPSDLQTRALAEQWMDWKLSVLIPNMTPIFIGLVRTPEAERNMPGIKRAIERCVDLYGMLNSQLADRLYLLGERFTMADVPFAPQVHRWMKLVPDRPSMPHLEAWYARMTERPMFRKHCMNPIV